MADTSDSDGTAAAAAAAAAAPVVPPTYDRAGMATEAQRLGALSQISQQARTSAMAKLQASNEATLRAIDETTAALKKAHGDKLDRAGPQLMAMAGALLSAPPGTSTNFFGELGRAFTAGAPYRARAQMADEE